MIPPLPIRSCPCSPGRVAAAIAAGLLLAAGPLAGQADAGGNRAPRAPAFTLAAGDHDLKALVDLLAQIRKTSIACELGDLEPDARRVHLQHEMRLDPNAWDDVVTTVLRSRDLVIVPAADGGSGTHRVVVVTGNEWAALTAAAEVRTAEAVLARPNQIAIVRSFHECKKVPVPFAVNMLRPVFASAGGQFTVKLAVDGDKAVLTGFTDDVACALRYLRAAEGLTAPAPAPPALPATPESAWPERDLEVGAFLDETARVLGANILWRAQDISAAGPVTGAARRLGPAAWHLEATRALRKSGLVLVPLDEGRRVFEVVSLKGPRARLVSQRARECTPEQVLAPDTPIEPVWVFRRMQHVNAVAAVNQLRPRIAGSQALSVGCCEAGLVLWGLSDEVAAALAALTPIDTAPPK